MRIIVCTILCAVMTLTGTCYSRADSAPQSHPNSIRGSTLTLEEALYLAQVNDPLLRNFRLQSGALDEMQVAADALPDPVLSLGALNLPVDDPGIDREPMGQFRLALSQRFPRGDSRAIKQARLGFDSDTMQLMREDRSARISAEVTDAWLEAYRSQTRTELIERDRTLFEQMVEITRADYVSALGKSRQQDVIRAQLELLQLDERIAREVQLRASSFAKLRRWLVPFPGEGDSLVSANFAQQSQLSLPAIMPAVEQPTPTGDTDATLNREAWIRILRQHPAVLAQDARIQSARQASELLRQNFKPQWGINASYGYRNRSVDGATRSDLLSFGLSVDMPWFNRSSKQRELSASLAMAESRKTEKYRVLRDMIGAAEENSANIRGLRVRQRIYQGQLLNQSAVQAEAALTAYTNDEGDFAEVVRARIAELDARIEALDIDVELNKAIAWNNYYRTVAQLPDDYAQRSQ